MRNLSILSFFIAAIFLVSCNAVSVTQDFDRSANFNSYKTYSYHQKGLDKLKINDLDKRRILAALDREMATKGFTKVNSDADIVVNILTSSSQEVHVNNNYYNYGFYGYPGFNYPNVSEYTSGKIIIDIIDDKRNILVWQGVGKGLNIDNISAKEQRIPEAINNILKKFPPQK